MTVADLARGVDYFRQAIALDPEFALAWTGLSRAYWTQAGYGWKPFAEGFELARGAAKRALAIAPDLAEGHVCLGLVLQGHDWNWKAAEAEFRLALALAPGNADVLRAFGSEAGILGREDEALEYLRRSVALDPLSSTGHRFLGLRCAIYGSRRGVGQGHGAVDRRSWPCGGLPDRGSFRLAWRQGARIRMAGAGLRTTRSRSRPYVDRSVLFTATRRSALAPFLKKMGFD